MRVRTRTATALALAATAAVLTPAAAHATDAAYCSFSYGNSKVEATVYFYNRSADVDYQLWAASGSGSKELEARAANSDEFAFNDSPWVGAGSSESGVIPLPASTEAGGWTRIDLSIVNAAGKDVATVEAKRDGSCVSV